MWVCVWACVRVCVCVSVEVYLCVCFCLCRGCLCAVYVLIWLLVRNYIIQTYGYLSEYISIYFLFLPLVVYFTALSATSDTRRRRQQHNMSEDDAVAAANDWLEDMKKKKLLKMMKRERWTKIALAVDRFLLWFFVALIILGILLMSIFFTVYANHRLSPNIS